MKVSVLARHCRFAGALLLVFAASAGATEWYVAPGGSGTGAKTTPFGRIQDALNVAQPGDTVTLRAGTYEERIHTVRHGRSGAVIRVRAESDRGSVLLTVPGRVVTVAHAYVVMEGLVIDGQYGDGDTLRVETAADYFTLRDTEVRRSTRDLIDIGAPVGVVIEHCLIHHALNASGGRTDAHGIAAGAVQRLTIRNTEIHTFSGDGFQVDPGRAAPGWNDVVIENVRFWLAPLPAPENGFAAGTVPGENAIDTKASAGLPRARLIIRNATATGFGGGLIGNMAAFNLKEHIDATLDGVTVSDSEIAFRLRGAGNATTGAWVTIKNAVVHDVVTAYRYEDDIARLRIYNNTVGAAVTRVFQAAASSLYGLEVRNLLVLGSLPREAAHASNLGVDAHAFVDSKRHDYRLAPGARAIDSGVKIPGLSTDRNDVQRPIGAGFDVGAFEWQPPDSAEIVRHIAHATTIAGTWRIVADVTAAGGARLSHPDAGAALVSIAKKAPAHYFELAVPVEAGRPYRLWLRARADANSAQNDSVFVQFSSTVTTAGMATYRIGTTSAAVVSLEDCTGCGVGGWGWQDNGVGVETLGPAIRFATSGVETIRIQTREDGISIDQLVLSPVEYLNASPGLRTGDSSILVEAGPTFE